VKGKELGPEVVGGREALSMGSDCKVAEGRRRIKPHIQKQVKNWVKKSHEITK